MTTMVIELRRARPIGSRPLKKRGTSSRRGGHSYSRHTHTHGRACHAPKSVCIQKPLEVLNWSHLSIYLLPIHWGAKNSCWRWETFDEWNATTSDFKLGTWNHMPPPTWWFLKTKQVPLHCSMQNLKSKFLPLPPKLFSFTLHGLHLFNDLHFPQNQTNPSPFPLGNLQCH